MNLTPTPIIPQRGAFSIASHTKPPSTNERNVIQTPTQVKHAMEKVQREMAAIIRDNSPSSATIIPPNSPLTSSKYNKKRIGDKDNKNNINVEKGGSHMVYPYHNKVSPRRITLNLQSRMKKLEMKALKKPSSASTKNYRNAMLVPKSKEPTGFLRSSNRFGAKAAYEPPETLDFVKSTNINYHQSPKRIQTNVGVRRPGDARKGDMTLTLYEERQDPDRHNIPVRTAQTVLTAEKKRQFRHPRIMEAELIKYEKQNALLTEALGQVRRELVVTKEKLNKSEANLSKSNEKVNTLLVLVQDVLHRWVEKQNNDSGSKKVNDDDFDVDDISGILKNNEKMFQLGEEDLLESSDSVIQSYVDGNNKLNSTIDNKLKSIEALLYEK
eukprot:g9904.t1